MINGSFAIIQVNGKYPFLRREDNRLWEMPGGGYENSEYDYKKVVLREIEEEMGIKLSPKQLQLCAKEYIDQGEKFCVFNCDDIFDKKELEHILENPVTGIGVTKKTIPAKYHGVRTTLDGYIDRLERHPNEDRQELVTDIFTNGFFILDSKIFGFPPVSLIDGEFGLP